MGRMLLLLLFEISDQPGLGQHFPGQVVLRGGHVVAPGHMGYRQGQTTTGLIAMTQLSRAGQLW